MDWGYGAPKIFHAWIGGRVSAANDFALSALVAHQMKGRNGGGAAEEHALSLHVPLSSMSRFLDGREKQKVAKGSWTAHDSHERRVGDARGPCMAVSATGRRHVARFGTPGSGRAEVGTGGARVQHK